ncbi:MAG: ABC transporter permease subunit [Spirochaetales bacterium]|nr:ABC transporter permease subunit [Spirochaetales bacterium]
MKSKEIAQAELSRRTKRALRRDWQLMVLCILPVAYFIIFYYVPMYGVQIAFKDFKAIKGIWGSPWVGLKHFKRFFNSSQFWPLLKNTLALSFMQLLIGFPVPIILAILLNQMRNKKYKKFVQSVVYCPHFISIVVLTSMLYIFLSPRNGIINTMIKALGGESIFFLGEAKYFRGVFVASGVWQNAGWNAIIYISALAGISPDLYEAAEIDGANKWQRIWHIDLPGILPTMVMMFIMEIGKVMNLGFQKAYLMQNAQNLATSEIISTYIYKVGLINAQYSYSAAINLFNNVINIILLISCNYLAKKITKNSLW